MAKALLSNLKYNEGSRKKRKRIGRGQGSGHGGTSTKGHKGQNSRSGVSYRPWFEGGQMPLSRRVPKFGFTNISRVEFQVVNVQNLETLAATGKFPDGLVNPEILHNIGAVSKKTLPVKVLGNGELKSKLEVTAHAFSTTATKKIESAGGKSLTISFNK